MIDYINNVFSRCAFKLNPIDPEKGESVNSLNGLNIILSINQEKQELIAKCELYTIDDLYDPVFQKFQNVILQLNCLDYLPSHLRIGINLLDLSIQIKGALTINKGAENFENEVEVFVKSIIFYSKQCSATLMSEYEKLQSQYA